MNDNSIVTIEVLAIIIWLIVSAFFGVLIYQNLNAQETVAKDVLGDKLEEYRFCEDGISDLCLLTQEISGEVTGNNITIGSKTLTLSEDVDDELDNGTDFPDLGFIPGEDTFVTIYTRGEPNEGNPSTYQPTEIAEVIANTSSETLCIDGIYRYVLKAPNDVEVDSITTYSEEYGHLTLFECFEDANERNDFLYGQYYFMPDILLGEQF